MSLQPEKLLYSHHTLEDGTPQMLKRLALVNRRASSILFAWGRAWDEDPVPLFESNFISVNGLIDFRNDITILRDNARLTKADLSDVSALILRAAPEMDLFAGDTYIVQLGSAHEQMEHHIARFDDTISYAIENPSKGKKLQSGKGGSVGKSKAKASVGGRGKRMQKGTQDDVKLQENGDKIVCTGYTRPVGRVRPPTRGESQMRGGNCI
jgi:hypothetical protein